MDKTNLVVSVVVSVAVVAGALLFAPQPNVTVEGPQVVSSSEQDIPAETLGAIPGNDVEGKYFTVGDVQYAYLSSPMIASSSVPCVFKSPFGARNAQIMEFSAFFSDTPTTVTRLSFSTSSKAYLNATTSRVLVFDKRIKANKVDTLVWAPYLGAASTSAPDASKTLGVHSGGTPNGTSLFELASTSYIGIKAATSTPGEHDVFAGQCSLVLKRI